MAAASNHPVSNKAGWGKIKEPLTLREKVG